MARRYIQIDNDTVVGYNYLKDKFYVTNKETTTYRNTAEQTVVVLNVLGITDYTAESLKEEIYNNYETLEKVYYTLEDGGAYIRTLQFNDWIGYPLEVDFEKNNIFIKNTEILFSLELNESYEGRVERFRSYYLETLGLDIDYNDMVNAYKILANQYNKPYFYNELSGESGSTTYKYTGSFSMSNFNNLSAVTCEGIKNPNGLFSTQYLVNLESIDSANYVVNFQKPINPENFKDLLTDSKIVVQGTSQDVEDVEYNSDGTYTITELINSSLGDKTWSSLAYGDNKLVALSSDGFISVSVDKGETWSVPQQVKELGDKEWVGLAYGNDRFIAISRFGHTSESNDGTSWDESTFIENLSDQEWTDITYISSTEKFMALSYYGFYSIYSYSSQEQRWVWAEPQLIHENMPEEERKGWVSLTYFSHNSDDSLIAINNSGYYATASANAFISFIIESKPISKDSNSWTCVAYGNGEVIALSSEGYTATGIIKESSFVWDAYQSDSLGKNKWSSVAYCEDEEYHKFVALSSTGYLSSNESTSWTKATTKSDNNVVGLQVSEPLLYDYQYPYPTCYVQSISCLIESMEREGNIIKILKENFPQNLLVGDTIHVQGAVSGIEPEIVSCDGTYTVNDISTQVKQISDSVINMGYSDDKNIIEINSTSTELKVADVITVKGTNTSSDKSYTINEILTGEGNVQLVVEESIPYFYGYSYSTDQPIEHVEFIHTEVTNAIKLPASFNAVINEGDIISISTTNGNNPADDYTVLKVIQYTSGERLLQLDGTVTANPDRDITLSITSMATVTLSYSETLYYNIYVEEDIPTNFISSENHQAKFYKEVLVGNITRINSVSRNQSRIYFDSISSSVKLTEGNILYIYISGQKYVSKIANDDTLAYNQVLIGTEEDNVPYISQMPNRASVSLQIPREDTLLTITEEHDYLNDVLPLGNFMVDSFEQCQAYIKSLAALDETTSKKTSHIPDLPSTINDKMFQELSKGDILNIEDLDVTFKGLYNEVYSS